MDFRNICSISQLIRLGEHSDVCQKCGARCCKTGVAVNITDEQIKLVPDNLKYLINPIEKGDYMGNYGGATISMKGRDGSLIKTKNGNNYNGICAMLDDKNLCMLHNTGAKPYVCEEFMCTELYYSLNSDDYDEDVRLIHPDNIMTVMDVYDW